MIERREAMAMNILHGEEADPEDGIEGVDYTEVNDVRYYY
jgi:hypothetical protein